MRCTARQELATFDTQFVSNDQVVEFGQRLKEMALETPFTFDATQAST